MIVLPKEHSKLVSFASELVKTCRVSAPGRTANYRLFNRITEAGGFNSKSLINLMYANLDRLAGHLYSPIELKFAIEFDNPYGPKEIDRAAMAANLISRRWRQSNTDHLFGRGVFDALKYGASILKQWPEMHRGRPTYQRKIVMPWQFGVFNETENDIGKQEVLCETISLTIPELYRRVYHLPNCDEIMRAAAATAGTGSNSGVPDTYFNEVLSTSQLQTGVDAATRPLPGGVVSFGTDPNYPQMGPTIGAATVEMHELWIKGTEEQGYVTIQLLEPDILIGGRFKHENLLISGSDRQPYTLIQPNVVANFFWGRSELVDLIEPQNLLSIWADDIRRLFGLQIDKILGFTGDDTIDDERYGQMRGAGYVALGQNASISDLTPKMPPESIPMLRFVIEIINMIEGFPDIMQGRGESGVRAGVHANTLLKTASPTQRDRALLVERQVAEAGDLTFALMKAKDPQFYWPKAEPDMEKLAESRFLLSDIPDDGAVTVDSHSSSPIFSDENIQLIFQARKLGDVSSRYMLDNLPFPNKAAALADLTEKQKMEGQRTQMMIDAVKNNPEAMAKVAEKGLTRR